MSTNSPHSKDRLNQLALRKLTQLGANTRLNTDDETVEVDLKPPPTLRNPLTGVRIPRIRAVAETHDKLRLTFPPVLGKLPLFPFYDLPALDGLWGPLETQLKAFAGALHKAGARLKPLGFSVTLDGERGVFYASFNIAGEGLLTLEGDEKELAAVHLASPNAHRPSVWVRRTAVDLNGLHDRTDTELHLAHVLPQLREGASPAPAQFEPPVVLAPEPIEATHGGIHRPGAAQFSVPIAGQAAAPRPASGGTATTAAGLTLAALGQKFGADALVADGVVIVREATTAAGKWRFEARHVEKTTFAGRLLGPQGKSWEHKFELAQFPGMDSLLASLGQAPAGAAPAASSAGAAPGPAPQGGGMGALPHPGERWFMRIRVEGETPAEVTYVALDNDWQAYGAPRTLPRAQFESLFLYVQGGHRLPVRVDACDSANVSYTQLSPNGAPIPPMRTAPISVFSATFVSEAEAY